MSSLRIRRLPSKELAPTIPNYSITNIKIHITIDTIIHTSMNYLPSIFHSDSLLSLPVPNLEHGAIAFPQKPIRSKSKEDEKTRK